MLVWKGVLARLPEASPNDDDAGRDAFFHGTRFTVAGEEVTLGDLENQRCAHDVQRSARALRAQLRVGRLPAPAARGLHARQARGAARARGAHLLQRAAQRRLRRGDASGCKLSHIFDWYKDDFGGAPDKVIAWINRYRPDGAKLPADAKIEYVDYDWSLNIR